ncbi:MAG: peptidoglycan D,D-transpeptidase FtsI family protein [Phycisphaerae bacterium]
MSEKHCHRVRQEIVFGILLLALVGLAARLVLLIRNGSCQVVQQAVRQQRMVIPLPGRVGSIRACASGSFPLLAGSRQAPLAYADPSLLSELQWQEQTLHLAEILHSQLTAPDRQVRRWRMYDEIISRRRQGRRYHVLGRDLSERQVEQIRQLDCRAVGIQHEWKREYPNGPLASAIVGFRRRDGVAGGGLELLLDDVLASRDGRRVMLADARRRPIWPVCQDSVLPSDGSDVFLTIDLNIQRFLSEAVGDSVQKFHAQWGTGIVINPHTGEILAMCSAPTFDPNRYSTTDPEAMANLAISAPVEPGSVLKPIYAAMAVQLGLVSWQSRFDVENGVYRAQRGGTIRDTHPEKVLSLRDIVIRSSNIGMAKIGEILGNERSYKIARHFGLGELTGIELPAESAGILRDLEDWDGYSMRRVPFGQEISTTTLQLGLAFSALANGGLLHKPRLIHHITDPDGKVRTPQVAPPRRVLSRDVAASALDVLREVVEDEHGTGENCRLSRWTSFGKTGTAQVPNRHGYNDRDYLGSFVGGAPAEKPALLVVISIYKPQRSRGYYGGTVAAPYVARVLEQSLEYLDVPPDKSVEALARTPGL